jgi:hypothetical protein
MVERTLDEARLQAIRNQFPDDPQPRRRGREGQAERRKAEWCSGREAVNETLTASPTLAVLGSISLRDNDRVLLSSAHRALPRAHLEALLFLLEAGTSVTPLDDRVRCGSAFVHSVRDLVVVEPGFDPGRMGDVIEEPLADVQVIVASSTSNSELDSTAHDGPLDETPFEVLSQVLLDNIDQVRIGLPRRHRSLRAGFRSRW